MIHRPNSSRERDAPYQIKIHQEYGHLKQAKRHSVSALPEVIESKNGFDSNVGRVKKISTYLKRSVNRINPGSGLESNTFACLPDQSFSDYNYDGSNKRLAQGRSSSIATKFSIPRVFWKGKEALNCGDDIIGGSSESEYLNELAEEKAAKRRHGPGRASWTNKIQLFLAFIGYSMGLPNVWRFPYLCYDNGGGAFFIPYIIMMLICGFPLLYLELAIGQLAQAGPIVALWKFSPLFKALGIASVMIAFVVGLYNIVIVTWSLFYVFKSFGSTLPWNTCHNKWNTKNCYSLDIKSQQPKNNTIFPNPAKYGLLNMTIAVPSTQEFFENRVLVMAHETPKYKNIQWELAILLFIAWIIVFVGIRRGVKSIGKAFYLTATVPFVVVIILLVKSVKLPGAYLGLNYLIKPDFRKLLEPEIWILGTTQSFYSLGIAFGSLIALASYNDENNNIFRDSIVMSVTSSLISIIVVVTTFSVIGHIAFINRHNVEEAITQGPGLVFVVYPLVFSTLPYAQLWAFLYFLMMICLGLDRQFAMVEVVVTSFYDVKLLDKYLPGRQALVLIACCLSYMIGLVFLARKGVLYLYLIDYFVVGISFVHVAFFEVLMVVLFFGVENLSALLQAFTHRKPSLYIIACWYAAPILITIIMCFHAAKHTPIRYDDFHNYPKIAIGVGWFLAYLPMITVLIGFVGRLLPADGKGSLERFKETFDSVMSLEAISSQTETDEKATSNSYDGNRTSTNDNYQTLDPYFIYRPWLYRIFFKSEGNMQQIDPNAQYDSTNHQLAHQGNNPELPISSKSDSFQHNKKVYRVSSAHEQAIRRQRRKFKNNYSLTFRPNSSSIKDNDNQLTKHSYVDPEEFVLSFMPELKMLLEQEKQKTAGKGLSQI